MGFYDAELNFFNQPSTETSGKGKLHLRPSVGDRDVSCVATWSAAVSRRRSRSRKTEIAKAIASGLGRRLIRLQCYEGLDAASAVYEWNFPAQMVAIRTAEASGDVRREALKAELFSEEFLIRRPLLDAMQHHEGGSPVLLIDELDRTDEPFEAFLLEALGDYQVTIPELGTVRAEEPPIVVLTSNRTREVHDALKRRCLYHWVGYPNFRT